MVSAPRDILRELSQLKEAEASGPKRKKRKTTDQNAELQLAKEHCEFAIAGPNDDLVQSMVVTIDDALCDDALEQKDERRARAFTVIPGLYWALYPYLNGGAVFKQEPKDGENAMELYLFMPTRDKWVISTELFQHEKPDHVEVFCEFLNNESTLPGSCSAICDEKENVTGLVALNWAGESVKYLKERDAKIDRLEADVNEKDQMIEALQIELEALNTAMGKKERNTERSNLGQSGQHGGWMPRFASLAQQYDAGHWSACRNIIDQALEKSSDFRRLYYSKKRGGYSSGSGRRD